MKTNLYTILVLITWILAISSPIDAQLSCSRSPNAPVDQRCFKVNEQPRVPILYRICGDRLLSAFEQICFSDSRVKRTASDVLLGKEKANRFLSSHHRTKRSFNPVEECCVEGCVPEEIKEYCK